MVYTLNMEYKRSYTRRDLTHEDGGVCGLCGNDVLGDDVVIAHELNCPLMSWALR